jgi:toxin ParE1/3/4
MRSLIYLDSALEDLEEIYRFVTIESRSLVIGTAFIGELEAHCEKLATLPGTLGTARPELGLDIRSILHGRYIIIFRYVGKGLEIVSVVNGSRDLERLFRT